MFTTAQQTLKYAFEEVMTYVNLLDVANVVRNWTISIFLMSLKI
jgi:hypothetical protein